MTAEAEPWTCHGDVVRRTFALRLDEQWHVNEVFAIPCGERGKFLQALGVRTNHNLNIVSFMRRYEETFFLQLLDIAYSLSIVHIKSFRRERVA